MSDFISSHTGQEIDKGVSEGIQGYAKAIVNSESITKLTNDVTELTNDVTALAQMVDNVNDLLETRLQGEGVE